MKLGIVQFPQVASSIVKSWAVGVEWFITSMEYRERGMPNYGNETYVNITPNGNLASYPLDRGY